MKLMGSATAMVGTGGRLFMLRLLWILLASVASRAWTIYPHLWRHHGGCRSLQTQKHQQEVARPCLVRSANSDTQIEIEPSSQSVYVSIFNFSDPAATGRFERLDDAIMGGISTSALVDAPGSPYAKWFGVCRTDGGGFCGVRTLPFEEPLVVGDADGFYLDCRLASDDEPERRVWKMTTRVKPDRGEQLYQANFSFTDNWQGKESVDDEREKLSWSRAKLPFSSFRLVRGPRTVPDGPPLNVTGGLFQVGLSLSKFQIGENLTELENFRPGFFELQLREIGLYYGGSRYEYSSRKLSEGEGDSRDALLITSPRVLSKEEARKRRPLLLKVLSPVGRLFFSEQSQRRKSAMTILREKRGLSRAGAIRFGLKSRASTCGIFSSLRKTLSILAMDSFRSLALLFLRLTLIYPIRLIRNTLRVATSLFRRQPNNVS